MDGKLKCFKHLWYATMQVLSNGKPTNASPEDWDFALAAFIAFAED